VTTSAAALAPQFDIEFNRDRARALSVSVGTAASAIRAAFGGDLATQFTGEDGLKDVLVTYPLARPDARRRSKRFRSAPTTARSFTSATSRSSCRAPAPPLIVRINRQNVVSVGANLAPGALLSNVQRDFTKRVAALNLPSTVTVARRPAATSRKSASTVTGMSIALLLSIILVYLLMVALYNSYRTPFIIMFAVPVAVVGALGSLAVTHQTLNLFSLIGAVLLDRTRQQERHLCSSTSPNARRREGMSRVEAMREAAGNVSVRS
jgi:HAE1 family hydrophobic/amphiphilic exporter-1